MAGKHSVAYSDVHSSRRSHTHSHTDAAPAGPSTHGSAAGVARPPANRRKARLGVIAAGSAGALGTAVLLLGLVDGLALMPWGLGPDSAGAEAMGPSVPGLGQVRQDAVTPLARAETFRGRLASSATDGTRDRRVLGDAAVSDGTGGRAPQAPRSEAGARPGGRSHASAGTGSSSGPLGSAASVPVRSAPNVPAPHAPVAAGGAAEDAAETVGGTVGDTVGQLGRMTEHLVGGMAGMTGLPGGLGG